METDKALLQSLRRERKNLLMEVSFLRDLAWRITGKDPYECDCDLPGDGTVEEDAPEVTYRLEETVASSVLDGLVKEILSS